MNDILVEELQADHYLAKLTKPSEMWHVEVDFGDGIVLTEFGATKEQALERTAVTLAYEVRHAQEKLDHVNKCWRSIRKRLNRIKVAKEQK